MVRSLAGDRRWVSVFQRSTSCRTVERLLAREAAGHPSYGVMRLQSRAGRWRHQLAPEVETPEDILVVHLVGEMACSRVVTSVNGPSDLQSRDGSLSAPLGKRD